MQAARDGVQLTGAEVMDIGICTTPMLHYQVVRTNDSQLEEYYQRLVNGFKRLTTGAWQRHLRRTTLVCCNGHPGVLRTVLLLAAPSAKAWLQGFPAPAPLRFTLLCLVGPPCWKVWRCYLHCPGWGCLVWPQLGARVILGALRRVLSGVRVMIDKLFLFFFLLPRHFMSARSSSSTDFQMFLT